MAEKECLKCIHHPVCKTAESCDGYVSGCEHFKEQKQVRMDVREKLVELFAVTSLEFEDAVTLADHLIAHGVTVQEWISVKDRLPENDQKVLCFMKDKSFGTFRVFQWNYIDWQWNDGNEWYDEYDVTHWMPLPHHRKENDYGTL